MTSANHELERLWNEFSAQLGAFLQARVASRAEAEDLRQDIFLRLQKELEADRSIRDLKAWLHRAARNAVIDHYRRRKPTAPVDENLPANSSAGEDPGLAPLMTAFRRMIQSLPAGYRDAVSLADIEELPHKTVSERLGLSLAATKSRVLRGRSMLRERLESCCRFERDRRGTVIDCEPKEVDVCPEC